MRLVLVGPPGAGKGTQAVHLAERLDVPHISIGDLIPTVTSSGAVSASGVSLVRLAAAKGFVLEGFPRTVAQADALSRVLAAAGNELDAVVALEVPEDVLVARSLGRGRADDTEDVIRRRQEVYREETAPVLDLEYYRERLVTVDAVGRVEEITQRVLDALAARAS